MIYMLGKHGFLSPQHPVATNFLEITQIYEVKVRLDAHVTTQWPAAHLGRAS